MMTVERVAHLSPPGMLRWVAPAYRRWGTLRDPHRDSQSGSAVKPSYHMVMALAPDAVGYRQLGEAWVDHSERRTHGAGDKHDRRRGGREQTTAAILDAAEKLFSERGFTAVTVRDIAAEAGVSHALVHRYLGSKQEVYRVMLARREDVIRDAAPAEGDLLEASSLMLREAVLNQRNYVRLITHSALHGLSYERTVGRFAATARLVELALQTAAEEGEARDPDAPGPPFRHRFDRRDAARLVGRAGVGAAGERPRGDG